MQQHNKPKEYSEKKLIWAIIARFMTIALFFDALEPLFPQMAVSHTLPSSAFQAILGFSYLIFAFSQFISVSVINKIGLYHTSAISNLFLGGIVITLCSTQNYYYFVVMFFSMFAINSIGSNATRVALREATSDSEYKRLIGLAIGWIEIIQIAMPLLAGAITDRFGWRPALIALIIPVVIAGVCIELFFYSKKTNKNLNKTNEVHNFSQWLEIVKMPSFLIPTLIAVAFQITFNPLGAIFPFILSDEAKLSPLITGLILSIRSCLVAAGLFFTGHFVSRWSSRHLQKIGVFIMIISLVIMIYGYFSGIYYTILGILFLQGAFGFIIIPCSGDVLNISSNLRAKASAIFGFIQSVIGGMVTALYGLLGAKTIEGTIILVIISTTFIIGIMIFRREG